MKKTIAMVMAVLLMVSMLAGCGAGGNDKNENGQTVISVGNWPSKEGVELENMNARKEAFETANKDIAIEPDLWEFDRKTFYAKAAGGQLPIVYNAGFTEISEIMTSEYAASLTDALKKYGYEEMFNPHVLNAISREGNVYALPKMVTVMGLMVNTDLFEEAGLMEADGTPRQPETWFEVVEFAKKIKEATGKSGFVMPTANGSGGWLFTALAWSFGVDFMEKDADGNWKATFNTPEAAEALQFVKDMKWEHDILPSNTLVDGAEWQKIFGTGNAGITFAAGEYPANVVPKYGIQPNQIGLIAMPKGPKNHVTLLAGDVICVSNAATEDQIDAAVRWIGGEITHKATDEYKANKQKEIETKLSNNQIVGIKSISIWNQDAEALKYEHQLIDEKTNVNPNHVKLYNEFAANCPCEIRPEEPVNAQELYKILDSCIQEVLTNKDADVKKVLEKANNDFQNNYLNNM
ncbi:MAG: extracellular solute-binding protein [Clostridia bacterium]|nr:extracellular solute-binding protein [Clostridia bacterium]